MNKDIININDKGQYHGYQEWYNINNKLSFRGNRKNDEPIGYCEHHKWTETNYYIK